MNKRKTATAIAAISTGQDNQAWLSMWRNDQIEFHQDAASRLLVNHWPRLGLADNSRVFVPLCGKSLDMLWLAQQGYDVVGVELSQVAVKAFFVENQIDYQRSRAGDFICWRSEHITILSGDFFQLTMAQLGHIDLVFDRASLTALNPAIRGLYVQHMHDILPAGQCPVYLLTVEDPDEQEQPFDIDRELLALYQTTFEIKVIQAERSQIDMPLPEAVDITDTKLYRLLPK
jgi:thiopurine S-methyltransferase